MDELLQSMDKGGVIGMCVMLLISGVKKWWVFGWVYEEMRADRDDWKRVAQSYAAAGRSAIEVAKTVVQP